MESWDLETGVWKAGARKWKTAASLLRLRFVIQSLAASAPGSHPPG
jgi:hypothetical protein